MKKIITFAAAILALISCGKDVIYELPDADKYNNLYLVQAVDNPYSFRMKTTFDGVVTKSFNAYYSGLSAPKDIHLTFEADESLVDEYNKLNGTSYKPLPKEAYSLSSTQAVIKTGECKSPLINVEFKVVDQMELYVEYLLPVKFTVKEKDIKIRENLQTMYYELGVIKDFSPVELKGNIANCTELFPFNDKCLIAWDQTAGKLLRYPLVEGGFGEAEILKEPSIDPYWDASYARMIFPCKGNTIHMINVYGSWISIQGNEDCTELNNVLQYSSLITGGCGIILSCIPYCHSDGEMLIDMATGGIRNYPLTENGLALTGALGFRTDFNYWPYILRFGFNDDIYGVDSAGKLWRHIYNPADFTYSSTPEAVGNGWGKFTHIFQFEDKLIARKSDGSLIRYDFDPSFYWDITE